MINQDEKKLTGSDWQAA